MVVNPKPFITSLPSVYLELREFNIAGAISPHALPLTLVFQYCFAPFLSNMSEKVALLCSVDYLLNKFWFWTIDTVGDKNIEDNFLKCLFLMYFLMLLNINLIYLNLISM